MLTAQQSTVALAKYCTPGVASMGGSGWWLDPVVAGWSVAALEVWQTCMKKSAWWRSTGQRHEIQLDDEIQLLIS